MTKGRITVLIACLIIFIVQIVIAPHIYIFSNHLNFIVPFCLVVPFVRPSANKLIMSFILGLLYDLLSGAPLGVLAFSLTLACAFETLLYDRLNNDTNFIALLVLFSSIVICELVYALIMLILGYSGSFIDALIVIILPQIIIVFAIALIMYPLAKKFFTVDAVTRSEIKQL